MPLFYKKNYQNTITAIPIDTAFPFLQEPGHIVSFVGGGGKTTLMYTLADDAGKKGYRTLVTTTTHIRKPDSSLWAQDEETLRQLWQQGQFAVIGKGAAGEKLAVPDTAQLAHAIELADQVFIEADGAKGKPLKAPASHEPVIWPQSDIVIGVMGLDALGKPIQETCFRIEEVLTLLQKEPEECITETDMVKILTAESGTKKQVGTREYYVVLNKYDTLNDPEPAVRLMDLLQAQGVKNVVFAELL